MADLIDRDELFHGQVILVGTEDARESVQDVMDAIWNAPTVDAVPVVRCRDCVNRGWENECPLYESAYITNGGDDGSNFYCAWGERKEDAVPVED